MPPAMPNSESIKIVGAMRRGMECVCRGLATDGETVTLHGSPIVRYSHGSIEVNLAGWGDTRTTRNNINSILCRMNLPYRVGLHKREAYLYRIIRPRSGNDPGELKPITTLPENGWTALPKE